MSALELGQVAFDADWMAYLLSGVGLVGKLA